MNTDKKRIALDEEMIRKLVSAQCDKHEIRGEDRDEVMMAIEQMFAVNDLLFLIQEGLAEVESVDDDGEPTFRLIEKENRDA